MDHTVLNKLQSGDCLLYGPSSLFGWIIAIKTWSRACHVEIYRGEGMSVASRNGIGVNIYPLRTTNLLYVRRPVRLLDIDNAMNWFFRAAQGQKYDWLGLLSFYLAVKQGSPNRMFCSEFATRWYREAGVELFNPELDADTIAPAQFDQTVELETIY